jgi:hypothetical protein
MPAVTIAALARHIEQFPPPEIQIWDRTDPDPRKHHRHTARLLFVTTENNPLHRATWGTSGHPRRRVVR